MEKLFKEYQRLPEVYATRPKPSLLLEAIAEQKAINFSLNEKLSKWQEWFESHHPNETPPVKTVKSPHRCQNIQNSCSATFGLLIRRRSIRDPATFEECRVARVRQMDQRNGSREI